jgi:hypothetical protein
MKSSTETDPSDLTKDLMLNDDPSDIMSSSDTVAPKLEESIVDIYDPSLTTALVDKLDPIFVSLNTLKLEPNR